MYHGRAGAREWFDRFRDVGGEIITAEIEEIAETGDNRILIGVFGTFRPRPGGDQAEFNARAWYVFWLRESKVSRAQLFWVRRDALEAAGLLAQDQGAH